MGKGDRRASQKMRRKKERVHKKARLKRRAVEKVAARKSAKR